MKLEQNIAGVPCTFDSDSAKPESVAFLLEYGWRQYLQDGAAVSKVHQSGDLKGTVKSEEEIAEEKRQGVMERLENIVNGEFTRRGPGAPKLSPTERYRLEITEQKIRDAAKAVGKKVPTKTGPKADAGWWEAMVAKVYTKYQGEIDKEVERRLKADAKPMDLTDLFE